MLGHRDRRKQAAVTAIAVVITVAGCGGKSTPSAATQPPSTSATPTSTAATPDAAAPGLAVPGIPDPCALLPAAAVLQAAHIPASARSGAVAAPGGGRACAYNTGHPDEATISLTAVSKAGFDAFRNLASGGVTDLPGIGQEAYRTSQTPGVVDVFKNGFDINIYVIHADSSAQATTDAKALAVLVAPKL